MSSNAMLQDTLQTSPSTAGPRFRPYASPSHHVTKGRYITSNDPRGYIPVYEYPLNGQWIMMDIDDGYILWTGIWKALGNSKADIVKMIDSQPDLAPLIRRVRGGYLKIQGTWMPYEVALRLSRRVAWTIRDDLIPLFGPTFPSTCLSPDQPGYGQVVASGPGRRRPRRNTQGNPSVQIPRETHTNWTVMTPNDPSSSRLVQPPLSHPQAPFYPHTRDANYYHGYHQQHSTMNSRPGHSSPEDPASPTTTSRGSVRYSPYSSHTPHPPRQVASDRSHLLLDIPSLSIRERTHSPQLPPDANEMEHITLPPIKAPLDSCHSRSPYALPPISAMEDLRGLHINDSAAVLRRLKSDESSPHVSSHHTDVWHNRQPFSKTHRLSDGRMNTPNGARPYQDRPYYSPTPSESDSDPRRSHSSSLSLSMPSDGISTCDPSPISPATPRSATSSREHHHGLGLHLPPLAKEHGHGRNSESLGTSEYSDVRDHHYIPRRTTRSADGPTLLSTRRHSDIDSESQPHRPW